MNDRPNLRTYESSMRYDSNRIRAAAVYCSDGRFGEQFDDLLQNFLTLPRYDRLAIPGGSACLARHFATYREEEGVYEQLRFLVDVHGLEQCGVDRTRRLRILYGATAHIPTTT